MGMNEADRLKAAGIQAKKGSVSKPPLWQLSLATEGPTAHPRAHLPPDEALVTWIMQHGMVGRDGRPWRFVVRDAGTPDDGVMILEIGDGSRRRNAGMEAERRLLVEQEARIQKGERRLGPLQFDQKDPRDPGRLHVEIEMFTGSDAEFILTRLAANSEPGKLPDSTEVLAVTVAQLLACGCTDVDAIVSVMPRGVGRKEVSALSRWGNLTEDARLYIVTHDLPPGLLSAILDAPRAEQLPTAIRLHTSGVKTTVGATRKIRQEREERTGEPASKARRWTPAKLVRCAKAISVPSKAIIPDADVTMTPEEVERLVTDAEARGFSKAMFFAAGEKTGKIPAKVREAIKAVNGQGKK